MPDIYQMLEDELADTYQAQLQPQAAAGMQQRSRWAGGSSSSSSNISRWQAGSSSGSHGSGVEVRSCREHAAPRSSVPQIRRRDRSVVLPSDSDEELLEELLGDALVNSAAAAATAAATFVAGSNGIPAGEGVGTDDFARVFGQVHGDGEDSPLAGHAAAAAAGRLATGEADEAVQELSVDELQEDYGEMGLGLGEGSGLGSLNVLAARSAGTGAAMGATLVAAAAASPVPAASTHFQLQQQEEEVSMSLVDSVAVTRSAPFDADDTRQHIQQQQQRHLGRVNDNPPGRSSSRNQSSTQEALQVLSLPPSPEPLHLRLRRAGAAPQHVPGEARGDLSSQDAELLGALGGKNTTSISNHSSSNQRANARREASIQQGSVDERAASSQRDGAILGALGGGLGPHNATGSRSTVRSSGVAAAPARLTITGARAVAPAASGIGLSAAAAAATQQGGRKAGAGNSRRPGAPRHHAMGTERSGPKAVRGEGALERSGRQQQQQDLADEEGTASPRRPGQQVAPAIGDADGSTSDEDFARPVGRARGVRYDSRTGLASRRDQAGQKSQRVVSGLRRTRTASVSVRNC
jgi:hypothetical protein